MPKKRTVKPFYRKINQSLEQTARNLTRAGQHEEAKEMFDKSDELIARRHRPIIRAGKY